MGSWKHNDTEERWEYSYYDELREQDAVTACITDEFIEKTADPGRMALYLCVSVGSVPPPLQGHIPPTPHPTVYW